MNPAPVTGLHARDVVVDFGRNRVVLDHLSLDLEPGSITAIVGPNGSGKSTLLRAMGRLRRPEQGTILLDGDDIFRRPGRDLARRLGVLPQAPVAPESITVMDLVARGRDPHRRWYDQWARADEQIVLAALTRVGLDGLAETYLEELSGGQRQRAWIAMALAQEASTILLDEPTTYLDVAHQLDVLELVRSLHRERDATIVMVLHDLSMASRYANRIVALRAGRIMADGTPDDVITPQVLREVFELEAHVVIEPTSGRPHVLPVRRTADIGRSEGAPS